MLWLLKFLDELSFLLWIFSGFVSFLRSFLAGVHNWTFPSCIYVCVGSLSFDMACQVGDSCLVVFGA